jgi:DNA mismatch repair protein MutS
MNNVIQNYDDIKLTPMMAQWVEAKKQYKDAILLFRMGDFYELFAQDAELAAPILDIALTARDKGKSGLKMAGFPYHAAQNYIAKLIEEGHKVAVCEQLEDPKNKKGLLKRGVKELITPATFIDTEDSISKEFNFLTSLFFDNGLYALASLELNSSSFLVTSCDNLELILDEINRISPKEIVFPRKNNWVDEIAQKIKCKFELTEAYEDKKDGLNEVESASVSLIENYLVSLHGSIPKYIFPKKYSIDEQLLIDNSTRINLNILPNKKNDKTNLLYFLTHTKTQMGRRFLHKNLLFPSTSLRKINYRHDIVQEFITYENIREKFAEFLSKCHDVEKIIALAHANKLNPRSMVNLRDSLDTFIEIKELCQKLDNSKIKEISQKIDDFSSLRSTLHKALVDIPPINLKEGQAFCANYDEILGELYSLSNGSKDRLLAIEEQEKKRTDISSLKVRYTRVFGYYIEITKSHLHKVPTDYIRKQTIANGERFVTQELNELEIALNTSSERIYEREIELFEELRQIILSMACEVINSSKIIGLLDCLCSFAKLSYEKNWVRPIMLGKEACLLKINQGRHPIVEHLSHMQGFYFVPNDIELSRDNCLLALITGPNMAGKSTIMRQVAIIQIMAQIGCFVPASSATLSICDAIFARVGASDDLALGRSTFMVEMKETSQILSQATQYSLILLDEIGRGTSTYDGLSIAQAVAEHLHEVNKSRTLFATHYHELTKLSLSFSCIKNFYVQAQESDGQIKFLYTLKEGFFGKSFGIEVAKLAGLPESIISRSEEILLELENNNSIKEIPDIFNLKPQLTLFTMPAKSLKNDMENLFNKIKYTDVNKLTPLQALNKVNEWQKMLKK